MIELTINGEKKAVPPNISIEELLALFQVRKETVVVEHNLQILKREALGLTRVSANDTVEIIRLVGGG